MPAKIEGPRRGPEGTLGGTKWIESECDEKLRKRKNIEKHRCFGGYIPGFALTLKSVLESSPKSRKRPHRKKLPLSTSMRLGDDLGQFGTLFWNRRKIQF